MLDVTLTGDTICGCAVTGDGEFYGLTAQGLLDVAALLGVHEDIPLNSATVIGTVEMQAYNDECFDTSGAPVAVDITMLVTCSDGFYELQISFAAPTTPSASAVVFFTNAEYTLDEAMANAQTCIGGTSFNVPWIFDSAEVSLA